MKLIRAYDVPRERLAQFLRHNDLIDVDTLLASGYVVECDQKIIGCFELELVEDATFWLKQLFIIRNEAIKLPVLLEFILQFAKQKNAKMVYAHSEKPVTDLLLESLSFSLQEENAIQVKQENKKGNWWSYKVC